MKKNKLGRISVHFDIITKSWFDSYLAVKQSYHVFVLQYRQLLKKERREKMSIGKKLLFFENPRFYYMI